MDGAHQVGVEGFVAAWNAPDRSPGGVAERLKAAVLKFDNPFHSVHPGPVRRGPDALSNAPVGSARPSLLLHCYAGAMGAGALGPRAAARHGIPLAAYSGQGAAGSASAKRVTVP